MRTFPVVVIEALGCGKPVLVTREVNIHPQIERAGAGIVCEANRASLASALGTWLESSVAERHAVAQRAAGCHLREFYLRRAVNSHVEAIRRNLSAPKLERKGVSA